MIEYQKMQYWRPRRLYSCFRYRVVVATALRQFLRYGRKPQICRRNCIDICHSVGDISTSGFDGHIAISCCPSMLLLFVAHSMSLAWSTTLFTALELK